MTLLNDIQGSTRQIMVYSSCHESEDMTALLAKLGNLPGLLPRDCCIVWVVRSARTLKFPTHLQGRPLLPVLVDANIDAPRGRWLQDPFLCLNDHEQSELVVTRDPGAFALDAGWRIAAATERTFRSVDLRFAGGNMLRLDDVLLIGKDLAYQNGIPIDGVFLKPDQQAWADLEARITTQFKVEKVVWVGLRRRFLPHLKPIGHAELTWQPFFHIDLFLLPGGRTFDGRLLLFIARPQMDRYDDQTAVSALPALQSALDEVEANLKRDIAGLQVAYLPLILSLHQSRWAVCSYCNGWVDIDVMGKTAYLPDYSRWGATSTAHLKVASMQASAKYVLETYGFSVRFVDMKLEDYAKDGGALHCAIKVLKRS